MAYPLLDTIVAIASPPGPAARAIVRLSGPEVLACVERLFVADATVHPAQRTVVSGNLHLPGLHSPLPADLYFWPDAHSYTGQPVAEFHTLGSPPLVDAVLRSACDAGARLAEPGEFTLRAFLAGQVDLTQAEAVLGVIEATEADQLEVALGQLAGGLSRPLHALRDQLLETLSHLEAGFDFPDEDVSFITPGQLIDRLAAARGTVSDLSAQLQSRYRAEGPAQVVLVGPTNVGKSSLFNALAGASGAIVSHCAGTTRDYLSAEIELDGVRFQLIDTAGVGPMDVAQNAPSEIETGAPDDRPLRRVAEQVARRESSRADARIVCIDTTEEGSPSLGATAGLPSSVGPWVAWPRLRGHVPISKEHAHASESMPPDRGLDILVLTKADSPQPIEDVASVPGLKRSDGSDRFDEQLPGLPVSSVTGRGLDALRARLRDVVAWVQSTPDRAVASTAARCGESLQKAAAAIDRAGRIVQAGEGEELAAAEIRVALVAIGRVAGTVHTDDVLDRVFSRFCIGK